MEDCANRRKNYYIKKEFQRNFIIKFCLLVLIGSLLSGAVIYGMSKATVTTSFENLRLVIKSTADFILPALVLSSLIFVVIVGLAAILITLFTSHRIAGPLYRIEKDVREIACGNLKQEFNLRQHDEITPLAEALNAAAHSLRDDIAGIKQMVDEAETLVSAPGSGASQQARDKIASLKARLAKFTT